MLNLIKTKIAYHIKHLQLIAQDSIMGYRLIFKTLYILFQAYPINYPTNFLRFLR